MKYPIGIQSFESIREGGYVYVDKTALLYKLTDEFRYVFLGRPRRFGKSLLMSTAQAYFEGRKELFEGLAISDLEKEWRIHPVLHFDLNTGEYANYGENEVVNVLNYQLKQYEKVYGGIEDTLSNRFLNLIKSAYEQTGQKVVILIDEYDKPVLSTINSSQTQDKIRVILKSFYGCLKTHDRYIRFAMLTGVSKFGKLSVFSDINNIKDISLHDDYATICGITRDEIIENFSQPLEEFAGRLNVTKDDLLDLLRKNYDGYRFSAEEIKVFNPYSLLNAFSDKKLKDYWFESGTPSFLVKLLKEHDYNLSNIDGIEIDEDSLYKTDDISPIPYLYQSGYLTIEDYNQRRNVYTLGYPNLEVEKGFLNYLLPYYSSVYSTKSNNENFSLKRNPCAWKRSCEN